MQTATDKLDYIQKLIGKLNDLTRHEPATYEFASSFDKQMAIDILMTYCKSDCFYSKSHRTCRKLNPDLNCMDGSTLYFHLLWLKKYLFRREIEILKSLYYSLDQLVLEFKNHNVYQNLYFNNMNDCTPCQLFKYAEIFVPETILITDGAEILTAQDLIDCINDYRTILTEKLKALGHEKIENMKLEEKIKLTKHFLDTFELLLYNQKPAQPNTCFMRTTYDFICHDIIVNNYEPKLMASLSLFSKLLSSHCS